MKVAAICTFNVALFSVHTIHVRCMCVLSAEIEYFFSFFLNMWHNTDERGRAVGLITASKHLRKFYIPLMFMFMFIAIESYGRIHVHVDISLN